MSQVALATIIECQECGARGLGQPMAHNDCSALRAWHRWFDDHPDRDWGAENPITIPLQAIPVVSVAGLAEQIKAELRSEDVEAGNSLDGPLGEAIANASGSYSLEFVTPEQLADGIAAWLVAE